MRRRLISERIARTRPVSPRPLRTFATPPASREPSARSLLLGSERITGDIALSDCAGPSRRQGMLSITLFQACLISPPAART